MAGESGADGAGLRLTDDVLSAGWDAALRLAWSGLLAGTTPVGAVVVTAAGLVTATGRGRRYESAGPAGQLAGSHVAHAEVNALAQLTASRDYPGCVLLTTLEPCGMCHGAAVQSTVGGVFYAGRDPYGGTASLRFTTPQARRRPLAVEGPLPDARGALAEILHLAFLLGRPSAGHVVDVHAETMPELTAYVRDARGDLSIAVRQGDYDAALGIAAAAPRPLTGA